MSNENATKKSPLILDMDSDLRKVAEFVEQNVPQHKRAEVAEGLAQVAPALWNRFRITDPQAYKEVFVPLRLREPNLVA